MITESSPTSLYTPARERQCRRLRAALCPRKLYLSRSSRCFFCHAFQCFGSRLACWWGLTRFAPDHDRDSSPHPCPFFSSSIYFHALYRRLPLVHPIRTTKGQPLRPIRARIPHLVFLVYSPLLVYISFLVCFSS